MHRIRVYVDNSVFGGTHDEQFAEASGHFFEWVRQGGCVVLVSRVVLDEIEGAPKEVRQVLADLPAGSTEEVPVDDEVNELAQAYVDAGVVASRRIADATHVAAATVARADLVLSWNFRHLVDFRRIQKFNGVNALRGYGRIEIHSPLEISYGDEDEDV